MNRLTKIKIALDVVMTILFICLMNLAWTGVFLHEWIAIGIVVLFAVHLIINRQWIVGVARRFSVIASLRTRVLFVLNMVLALAMGITVISGVLISQYLFMPLAAANIDLWYTLHAVASWLGLCVILAHTLLHWQWIRNVIRRLVPAAAPNAAASVPGVLVGKPAGGRFKILAARLLIGLFSLAAAYSLVTGSVIDLILPVSGTGRIAGTTQATESTIQNSTQATILAPNKQSQETVILPSQTTVADQPAVTLQQYLSKLYCTACHKHCLLTSPRCARGMRQADLATEEYYAGQDAAQENA
jgi:hypothetical protein